MPEKDRPASRTSARLDDPSADAGFLNGVLMDGAALHDQQPGRGLSLLAMDDGEKSARPRGIEVFRIREADWQVLRAARLTALRSSPDAFAASFAKERLWSRRVWRRRLRTATWIVARYGSQVVGLMSLTGEPMHDVGAYVRSEIRYVESVWVHPALRQRGVVRYMLQIVEEHARRQGVRTLLLWVLEPNMLAWNVYLRLGFIPTGDRQPIMVRHRKNAERRMMKCLT